jgi:hypothetical protein
MTMWKYKRACQFCVGELKHSAMFAAAPCSLCLAYAVSHQSCRLSNGAAAGSNPAPIYLDQVVLQYWFQGQQQAAAAAPAAAANDSSATSSIAAQADASQLLLGCHDAGAPLSEYWLSSKARCTTGDGTSLPGLDLCLVQ